MKMPLAKPRRCGCSGIRCHSWNSAIKEELLLCGKPPETSPFFLGPRTRATENMKWNLVKGNYGDIEYSVSLSSYPEVWVLLPGITVEVVQSASSFRTGALLGEL